MKTKNTHCVLVCLVYLLLVSCSWGADRVEVRAVDLPLDDSGFYVDRGKWLGINPNEREEASMKLAVPVSKGNYDIELYVVAESDGQSGYRVFLNDQQLGSYSPPLSVEPMVEGPEYVLKLKDVAINENDYLEVRARLGTDGKEYSRGRWSKLVFTATNPGEDTTTQSQLALYGNRGDAGSGAVTIDGTLETWHKITLSLEGPFAHERDDAPNPFRDYRMQVLFSHESGEPVYSVPGYFAADGDAANTSAESGNIWRAHLSPDKAGIWYYQVTFVQEKDAAWVPTVGVPLAPYHGAQGQFRVWETTRTGADFRAKGRLEYVGAHYLRFKKTGEHFLKVGPDAPETFLAYTDFDGTVAMKPNVPLKTWEPHADDYKVGDPTWQSGKGENIIGALNYLADKGANCFSFLTYNAGGDGDNVWPFIERNAKFHYDCSKLDQWGIVFEHAQSKGLYLHVKLQETEIDDQRKGLKNGFVATPEALDGGALGPERKLYFRELIARYGHNLALNWNLGEENTQTYEEQREMAEYILGVDPYDHHIVIHTYPNQLNKIYSSLLSTRSDLTGASLQVAWDHTHRHTLNWVKRSLASGQPWVVANDEQNPPHGGAPPDPGYQGFSGKADYNDSEYDLHSIRKYTLWGNLMAGGAGVEYYFGYKLPENDLICEDYRSRDKSWDYGRYALRFFYDNDIPFWRMQNMNTLVGNGKHENTVYCFARQGEVYVVYLSNGGSVEINLSADSGAYEVLWYNPRTGGELQGGSIKSVQAGKTVSIGQAPTESEEDWVVLLRR